MGDAYRTVHILDARLGHAGDDLARGGVVDLHRAPFRAWNALSIDEQSFEGDFGHGITSYRGVTYAAVMPPSTMKAVPVTKEDSSDARNSAA